MRKYTALFGILLLLVAIIITFVVVTIFNPPKTQVFVATVPIFPGDFLSDQNTAVVNVRADNDMRNYLTTENIGNFGQSEIIMNIMPGEFIPLSSFASDENPYSYLRIASTLEDVDMVALVIPVTPETCPEGIQSGDVVDLIVTVGSSNFLAGNFGDVPEPNEPGNTFYSPGNTGAGAADVEGVPNPDSPFGETEPTPTLMPVTLPVAKSIVFRAEVIQARFEIIVNPSFDPDGSSSVIRGDIQALVVQVPRINAEAVAFGIAGGNVRVALLHPNTPDTLSNSPGTTWEDLVAFVRFQRDLYAQQYGLDYLEQVGGSQLIVPTLQAAEQTANAPTPTSTPTPIGPTAEPSPTPEE